MAELISQTNILHAEETCNLEMIKLIKSNLPTPNENIIKPPKEEKNIDHKSNNN